MIRSLSLLVVAVWAVACNPGRHGGREFEQLMKQTRQKYEAATVRKALQPLFERHHYNDTNVIKSSEIPKEVAALPVFSEDPTHIMVGWVGDNPGSMMLTIGGGFGTWGLVVCREEEGHVVANEWHRKRIFEWGHGVYFYHD